MRHDLGFKRHDLGEKIQERRKKYNTNITN